MPASAPGPSRPARLDPDDASWSAAAAMAWPFSGRRPAKSWAAPACGRRIPVHRAAGAFAAGSCIDEQRHGRRPDGSDRSSASCSPTARAVGGAGAGVGGRLVTVQLPAPARHARRPLPRAPRSDPRTRRPPSQTAAPPHDRGSALGSMTRGLPAQSEPDRGGARSAATRILETGQAADLDAHTLPIRPGTHATAAPRRQGRQQSPAARRPDQAAHEPSPTRNA
jgi:hypothetical protein